MEIFISVAKAASTFQPIEFKGLENFSKLDNLMDLIKVYLPEVIATVGGIAFIAALIIGGIMYVTSAGNEEQAQKAKNTITWAIIGIVIIAISAAVIAWFQQRAGLS